MYIGSQGGVPLPWGGVCTYCNIQSIVKNLFKALRGRASGSLARRGPPGWLHEHFLFVHGLGLYELPLNISAPASLRPMSAGGGAGRSPRKSVGQPGLGCQKRGGAGQSGFSASDVFPALKAFRPSL